MAPSPPSTRGACLPLLLFYWMQASCAMGCSWDVSNGVEAHEGGGVAHEGSVVGLRSPPTASLVGGSGRLIRWRNVLAA